MTSFKLVSSLLTTSKRSLTSFSCLNTVKTSTILPSFTSISFTNNINDINYHSKRFKRFPPKKLLYPKLKKRYKHPEQKQEFEFSRETLESLSHGQDRVTAIRVSDFDNKHKHFKYPQRRYRKLKKKK